MCYSALTILNLPSEVYCNCVHPLTVLVPVLLQRCCASQTRDGKLSSWAAVRTAPPSLRSSCRLPSHLTQTVD